MPTHRGKTFKVDFTDVETREVVPEGDYGVEVVSVEEREGQKGPYLNWELKVVTGPFVGKKLWYVTSLAQQSLWVLRATLEALGLKTPSSKYEFNLDFVIGRTMGVKVEHRIFEGKTRAKITDIFPLDELPEETTERAEESEEEEEPEEEAESEEEAEEDKADEEESEEEPPRAKAKTSHPQPMSMPPRRRR